jgi:hypothetical protein
MNIDGSQELSGMVVADLFPLLDVMITCVWLFETTLIDTVADRPECEDL